MESIVSLCLGLGLAAACGLRVFVPLLVMAIGSRLGLVHLTPEFAILGSWGAIAVLTGVCLAELAAYYVPWIDHAMDAIATPAAVLAGGLAAAAQMGIISPVHVTDVSALAGGASASWMHPVLGIGSALAGGAVAGAVQTGTVAARSATTWTTAGVLNPIVSTLENIGALLLSVLAILVPAVIGLVLLAVLLLVVRSALRRRVAVAMI